MYRKHINEMESTANKTGIKTLDKITELPVVSSAINNVTDYYGQFKEKNVLLRTSCNLAELSLKTMRFASSPITSLCKKPIESVDTYLAEQVDFIETKYPLITQPTDQITSAAYSQARGIYDKPKETLYYTVSTAATCGGKVLESCLDNRYAKMVCNPVLDFTEKNLNYYLPTPSIYEEADQGTVRRIYNINRRVYSHVYEATFLQLSKLHKHFEHTIQKLYALKKLTEEIYTLRKEQAINAVNAVKQNTLVQKCLAFMDKNNISIARIEEISKSYYKSILADVNDIIEKYMCLVKKFPAYLNATQFRTTIENLRNQINKETFSIYLSMSIDYLKQLNQSLISYTNKMIEVAGQSKKSRLHENQIPQETQTLKKECQDANTGTVRSNKSHSTNTSPKPTRETSTQKSLNTTQEEINMSEREEGELNDTYETTDNDKNNSNSNNESPSVISEDRSFTQSPDAKNQH